MRILITGSHGLIGKAVTQNLSSKHELLFFSRSLKKSPNMENLPEVDAVIHLAGENISAFRWTKAKKKRIKASRCDFTAELVQSLIAQGKVPKVFLSASAIGYYGNRGEEVLDDGAGKGDGFLSDVCKCWEEASLPLKDRGTRLVHMRFGMVLAKEGGALSKMLPIFRLGLGGRLGSGQQWMSWIAIADLVQAIEFLLEREDFFGPVNLCSGEPVTNATFTKMLAKALNRPVGPPVPAFIVRLLFGEMGESLFLSSAKAFPKKLKEAGFSFSFSTLNEFLKTFNDSI